MSVGALSFSLRLMRRMTGSASSSSGVIASSNASKGSVARGSSLGGCLSLCRSRGDCAAGCRRDGDVGMMWRKVSLAASTSDPNCRSHKIAAANAKVMSQKSQTPARPMKGCRLSATWAPNSPRKGPSTTRACRMSADMTSSVHPTTRSNITARIWFMR